MSIIELWLKNVPATAAVIRQARVAAISAFTLTAAMSFVLSYPQESTYNTFSGGCICLSAILNYACNGADVSATYKDITNSYAGLSAPLRCNFSPYFDRPVNLASIQPQPPLA